jgi:hypothetical protein
MNYIIPEFLGGYAKGKGHGIETWLTEHVVEKLNNSISTVVDFGCANGRNFIPFQSKGYRCVGFDLHDIANIEWMSKDPDTYYRYSIEDFMKEYISFDIDWKSSLVMTHGTLMYLSTTKEQNDFLNLLKALGCNNFVFHEYGSEKVLVNLTSYARAGKLGWLDLTPENRELFEIKRFRDFENDMCAFIKLEPK